MREGTHEEWAALAADEALDFAAHWIAGDRAVALYTDAALAAVLAAIPLEAGQYPALSPHRPGAAWFERLAHDLHATTALGATDLRPAIKGTPWPEFEAPKAEGAHQIGVGPIHAGIIEPGHFRFTLRGEQVLGLETRLGWSHKGTLALIAGKSPRAAARFAARISGDSTVAHSIAFAAAAESALGVEPPPRAAILRALMLEIERIANHCGDIGAIAGDAGFAFLESRFALHREQMLIASSMAFGHRLMMDVVVPGGLAGDLRAKGAEVLLAATASLDAEFADLARVFETYASLQDRLVGTGRIPEAMIARFAPGGVVARASGRVVDARIGREPYASLNFAAASQTDGDIAARVRVRLAELTQSIRLVRAFLADLPDGAIALTPPAETGIGLGVAESFRGAAWHFLDIDNGQIRSAFAADPSTLHWPLLEAASMTGILADFPLINKSINGSYSGVDL